MTEINRIELSLEELVPSVLNNIVAIEAKENGTADVYIRNNDKVICKEIDFYPFILIQDAYLLEPFEGDYETVTLNGDEYFRFLIKFSNQKSYTSALKYLKLTTGYSASSPNSPYRVFSDLQQQVLIQNNMRLFRDMKFSDTRRLQVDIETLTTPGYDFPNAKREEDKIIIISFSDNSGWEKYLLSDETTSEKQILEQFVTIIKERDPDVIEGHNLFSLTFRLSKNAQSVIK